MRSKKEIVIDRFFSWLIFLVILGTAGVIGGNLLLIATQ